MKNIILASGSPRRKELLSRLGIEFEVITSNANEICDKTIPGELVMALSALKANAVFEEVEFEKKEKSVIIGADTIVYHKGNVLGKPHSVQDAFNMIKSISGDTHSVFTGVTLLHSGGSVSFYEETKVKVYPMDDDEINRYVLSGDCMDKAGSYGIQGDFSAFIEKIDGNYDNVVGLPLSRLYHELRKAGLLDD